MGNTRHWTREFNARQNELSAFVRSKAGKSEKARKDAIKTAACGRPTDLAQRAREAIEARRAADEAAIAMVERLQGGGL